MASKSLPVVARLMRPSSRLVSQFRTLPCSEFSTASPIHLARLANGSSNRPPSHQQIRWHSAPASKSEVYDFEKIKSLSETPSKERILIDVREPREYAEGYIPTSINIPIISQPEALVLPADEFEDRFGFPKPTADQEVVFYCKAGVRSSAAAKLAEQAGYQKIGEYRGSWLEWAAKGGKVSR